MQTSTKALSRLASAPRASTLLKYSKSPWRMDEMALNMQIISKTAKREVINSIAITEYSAFDRDSMPAPYHGPPCI